MCPRGERIHPSPVPENASEGVQDRAAGEGAEGPHEQELVLGSGEGYVEPPPVSEEVANGALGVGPHEGDHDHLYSDGGDVNVW